MSKKKIQKELINLMFDNMNYEEIREVITLIILENTNVRKELIQALKEYNPRLYINTLEYLGIKEM